LTEADAGSDASAIRSRATKDNNGYRLNGSNNSSLREDRWFGGGVRRH